MNLKKIMKNKYGGYILESSLIIPVFVAAIILVISILPILGMWEEGIFAVCNNMRVTSIESLKVKDRVTGIALANKQVRIPEFKFFKLYITPDRYDYEKCGIDRLFTWNYVGNSENKLGILNIAQFKTDGKVTARLFLGKSVNGNGSDIQFHKTKIVIIFPNSGKRYHKKNCFHVKTAVKSKYLESRDIKTRNFCKICGSRKAHKGDKVYLFGNSGKYHFAKCRMIKKYYIKINRKRAKEKGYTPCLSCGG